MSPESGTLDTQAGASGDHSVPEVPYDLGFQPAIDAGHLTIQQAMERGEREALRRRLAQRFSISMELAEQVADNRLSVGQILSRPHASAAPVGSSGRRGLGLAIGTLAVAVLAGAALVRGPDPGEAHFTEARKLVAEFEKGKDPASVNYDDTVYPTALAELALIDEGSSFSARARALEAETREKIEAYHLRLQAQRVSTVANRDKRRSRLAGLHQARKSERVKPPPTYEECEH